LLKGGRNGIEMEGKTENTSHPSRREDKKGKVHRKRNRKRGKEVQEWHDRCD